MNRRPLLCVVLLSAPLAAQEPVPPVFPMPPTPAVAPTPPVPVLAPRLPATTIRPAAPVRVDSPVLADELRHVREQARVLAEQARVDAEIAGDRARREIELERSARGEMLLPIKIAGAEAAMVQVDGRASEAGASYNAGLNQLQQRQFDRAVISFDRSVAARERRADGALYWKAFAQYRLLRRDDALSTLAVLRRDYPDSRYRTDAKVLETDARRVTGGTFDADVVAADEDIRLLALQGLQRSATDKAVSLVEGVLTATHSLRVKRQALAVLGQSQDPQARQVLLKYAKGAGNPDLQMEAIRQLASRPGRPASGNELKDIYDSAPDAEVRLAVIGAYRQAGDKAALLAVYASSGSAVELRRAAIASSADLLTADELTAMYRRETEPSLRLEMVPIFGRLRATAILAEIAKTDRDLAVRQRAIRSLGEPRTPETSALLSDIYTSTPDVEVKKSVISILAARRDGDALVAIARSETSLPLKTDIVRRLSSMAPQSKAAADFLMGVLNR